MEERVQIDAAGALLDGVLAIPKGAKGIVLFAHGKGSGKDSPRNISVAEELHQGGIGTLLVDLLTDDEEEAAARVVDIIDWLEPRELPIGLIGSSSGAAAALIASTRRKVAAVVSRGGRPDLATPILPEVTAPTLLIVGSYDLTVLQFNQKAFARLTCRKRLDLIAKATHLFEEPGTLEKAAKLARHWFLNYL